MDNQPRASKDPVQGDVMREIRSMQATYTSLVRRVDALAESITSTTRLAMTLSASATTGSSLDAARTKKRLLLFARRNATQVLRAGHAELSRNIPHSHLCQGNSATQVLLRSKSSDASLADFRVLVKAFTQSASFHCEAFPSSFYAMSIDAGTCSRVDLLFKSYFDICQALTIPVDAREDGVYKEKKNSSRQLRAVQLLGVDAPDRGCSTSRERRIILGHSDPSVFNNGLVHVLHQKTMSWIDNTCDVGFEHRQEDLSSIAQITSTSHPYVLRSSRRTSNINRSPPQENVFRMTWMRNTDSASYAHVPPEEVSGSIRTFFPAVVLRPRLLTSSAQTIFSTPISNRFLKQLLVSPSCSQYL